MNLYLRLLLNLLISRWQRRIHTGEVTSARFRVWPQDIDVFGHMNNGRYLQIMDLARSAWMSRAGVLGAMRQNQWGAALGGGAIRFRRSLKAFQSYRVTTRLICWDHRWFYLEHGFIDDQDRCIAVGISRAAIRSRKGWVRTNELMDIIDPEAISAPVPDYLSSLGSVEEGMQRAYLNHAKARKQHTSPPPAKAKQPLTPVPMVRHSANARGRAA